MVSVSAQSLAEFTFNRAHPVITDMMVMHFVTVFNLAIEVNQDIRTNLGMLHVLGQA